jgi:outer membrane biosynthesis protein TonB
MKRLLIHCSLVIFALTAQVAFAQPIPPNNPPYLPPPPPPPPPPKIDVPAIPKMDELPKRSYAPIAPQKSFGDRVTKCLDDAAASGLGPNERATYSRNCATR